MQYTTTVLLAALSTASGVLAAPHHRENWGYQGNNDNNQPNEKDVIRLGLGIPGGEGGTTFGLGPITGDFNQKVEFAVRQSQGEDGKPSVFTTVEFQLGENIQNKDLRCKVFDAEGKVVTGKRGKAPKVNYEDTFSDKGNGAWTFIKVNSTVSKIECDPAFMALSPEEMLKGRQTTVELRTEVGAQEFVTVGPFEPFTEELKNQVKDIPEGDKDKDFKSVNVKVGRFTVPQTLRCAVQGPAAAEGAFGTNVIGQRKANIDETFADGGNGEWTFIDQAVAKPDVLPPAAVASKVSKVVCDSTFQKSTGTAPPVTEPPMNTYEQQ